MRCGGARSHNAGRRPYLVLSRDSLIGTLSEALVAVVARAICGIPTQVEIDTSDEMREACAVDLDDMLMMPPGQLTERQRELSPGRMAEVRTALDAATEC